MACASSTDDNSTASAHIMNPDAPAYCPSHASHDGFETCNLSEATFEVSVLCLPADTISWCHGGAEPLQRMNPDAPVFCPSDTSLDNLLHACNDYIDPNIEVSFLCIAMDGAACIASTAGDARVMNPNAPEFCPSDISDVLRACGSTARFDPMVTKYLPDYTQSCALFSELHDAGLIEHGPATYFLPDGILDNFDDPLDDRHQSRRNEGIQENPLSQVHSTHSLLLRQVRLELSLRCWRPAWHQSILPKDCMRLLVFERRQFEEWSTQCDGDLVHRSRRLRLDHKVHMICTNQTKALDGATSSSQSFAVTAKPVGQFGQSHSHRTPLTARAGASHCHYRNSASWYGRTRMSLDWWHYKQSAQHDQSALTGCTSIPRFVGHDYARPAHTLDLRSARTLARKKSVQVSITRRYVAPIQMQLARIVRNVVYLYVLLFGMIFFICRRSVSRIRAFL